MWPTRVIATILLAATCCTCQQQDHELQVLSKTSFGRHRFSLLLSGGGGRIDLDLSETGRHATVVADKVDQLHKVRT